MNFEQLKEQWLEEEAVAHIQGWDFSHIYGRYEEEEDLPWNYERIIRKYIRPELKVLDIDTGGGEFLLSLQHPFCNTSATEGYPQNVALCKRVLLPLGIDFCEANCAARLPYHHAAFDLVINRHGDFDSRELFRIMKPGGIFITEQVGAENDRALVDMLLPNTPIPFPEQRLSRAIKQFEQTGFEIIDKQEAFRPIKFYDIGALVWFARIIEWEFPDFSVERCFSRLCMAQEMLDESGVIEGQIHRFLIVAQKPEL